MFEGAMKKQGERVMENFFTAHEIDHSAIQDWREIEDASKALCNQLAESARENPRCYTEEMIQSMRTHLKQRAGRRWETDDPFDCIGPVKHRFVGVMPKVSTADLFSLIGLHMAELVVSRQYDPNTAGHVLWCVCRGQSTLDAVL